MSVQSRAKAFILVMIRIIRRGPRKLHGAFLRYLGRVHARVCGTEISGSALRQALAIPVSDDYTLLRDLKSRQAPVFFVEPDRHNQIVDSLRAVCVQIDVPMIAAADQVCAHTFDLLGSGPANLGQQIDWHLDFKTGYRFNPRQYYATVRSASYPGGYDIKVPWELSRFQHLAWLGQAYWFSNDEKYAEEFVAQVSDWIEQNPPQFGVNWTCTMDVAIRAVNWLWGYYFFKDARALTNAFVLTFFKSLLAHGRHIFRNLENQADFTGNHYLADIVGLIYLGILCPEFKEARRWREFGLRELEREMFKQVYPDGVDFEASTSYHRLVTEMFLSATILARLNGHQFSASFMECLEKMIEFVMHLTRPDGTVPLIGDNDNGRIHRLKVWSTPEREWNDFRYLLAIGAVVFQREDFAHAAGDQWEEALWLLGQPALAMRQAIHECPIPLQFASKAFPDSGLYIMRHNDQHLAISVNDTGQSGRGGHNHNDKLSFEWYAYGRVWLVDPGTYIYTADYAQRNRFRSTAFHNTVTVDGQEQLPLNPRELFLLPQTCKVRVLRWQDEPDAICFEAEHDGYTRLSSPVVHRRLIRFDKRNATLRIEDTMLGNGKHSLQLHWHVPMQRGDSSPIKEPVIDVTVESPLYSRYRYVQEESMSPGYGLQAQHTHIVDEFAGCLPITIVSQIRFEAAV